MTQTAIDRQKPNKRVVQGVKSIFDEFTKLEAFGGILLLIATITAVVWANSPWSASYFAFWHTEISLHFGEWVLANDLSHWINDGLMAIFFFVVGLEIKREVLAGELATLRKAILPVAAAIGGMFAPALIYVIVNAIADGNVTGWGIPMATDIAFTLGVLALIGKRIPLALKVFVTALAIVDDIGAVLVIALFYTAEIQWIYLAIALATLIVLFVFNRAGVSRPLPYVLLGLLVWGMFLYSGVHATIAGVLVAMTIPAYSFGNKQAFLTQSRDALDRYESACEPDCGNSEEGRAERHYVSHSLGQLVHEIESPLQRAEHALHPWVTYLILPVFALANAGVALSGEVGVFNPVSVGIILGLVFGKTLGISLMSWLTVRLGLAELPENVEWRHVIGVSLLAGIGFTMSMFVANLAFTDATLLATSKVGVILASTAAGLGGWLFLTLSTAPKRTMQTLAQRISQAGK
ncbi:MAG: Na+/H+ antiporter NhaA [Chloroflexi bacterium]|nr:Na+/H+ antiporter NhaA [Chloroflexota bacterium]